MLKESSTIFPINFFPEEIEDVILEVCSVYKFNQDFLCASILCAAASAFGNTYSIRIKEGWTERPTLFMAISSVPGVNKSAPLSWALRPIEKREKELYKQYKETVKLFMLDEKNANKLPPPLIKTIVSDATPEAVVQQLHKNERGILIYNDELSGFLNTFQRYNKGNDEQFYLSVWSGKSVVVDRKTSASIRINEPVINIIGTIQPSVLEKSFQGKEESGFFDRWLIINPDAIKKEYWNDEDVSVTCVDSYTKIIDKLQDIQFRFNSFDEPESIQLNYSKEAYLAIKRWQRVNTDKINATDSNLIKAIRSKMETYIHRFALINHMIKYACSETKYVDGIVDIKSAEWAHMLSEYFVENAIRSRMGDKSESLTAQWKEVFDMLPDNEVIFTTAEFLDRTTIHGIGEKSAKRWLKDNIGSLIVKVAHGKYSKKSV